jgi:Holliday junction resolvasome RuvABC endonuclease subunit
VSFRNVASALVLSEARGVCRLAVFETLAHAERRLVEISPTQVKKAAVGYGSASKDQVSRFLAKRFRMTEPQAAALGPDSFDAVAVAWATCLVLAKEGVRSGRGGIDGNELRSADQG